MMEDVSPPVTVIVVGLPQYVVLDDLATILDKLLDTQEIKIFRLRDLPNHPRTGKRIVALDFLSGYDAIEAQITLHGYEYLSDNGRQYVLSAKITQKPELMRTDDILRKSMSMAEYPGYSSALVSYTNQHADVPMNNLDVALELQQKAIKYVENETKLIKAQKLLRKAQEQSEDSDTDSEKEKKKKHKKKEKKKEKKEKKKSKKEKRKRSPSPVSNESEFESDATRILSPLKMDRSSSPDRRSRSKEKYLPLPFTTTALVPYKSSPDMKSNRSGSPKHRKRSRKTSRHKDSLDRKSRHDSPSLSRSRKRSPRSDYIKSSISPRKYHRRALKSPEEDQGIPLRSPRKDHRRSPIRSPRKDHRRSPLRSPRKDYRRSPLRSPEEGHRTPLRSPRKDHRRSPHARQSTTVKIISPRILSPRNLYRKRSRSTSRPRHEVIVDRTKCMRVNRHDKPCTSTAWRTPEYATSPAYDYHPTTDNSVDDGLADRTGIWRDVTKFLEDVQMDGSDSSPEKINVEIKVIKKTKPPQKDSNQTNSKTSKESDPIKPKIPLPIIEEVKKENENETSKNSTKVMPNSFKSSTKVMPKPLVETKHIKNEEVISDKEEGEIIDVDDDENEGEPKEVITPPRQPSKNPRFIMPVNKILKKMNRHIKDFDTLLKYKMKWVLKETLRTRIKELMKDHESYMNTSAILLLYRQHYPKEDDAEFVAITLKEINEGKHDVIDVDNLDIVVKKEKEEDENRGPKVAKQIEVDVLVPKVTDPDDEIVLLEKPIPVVSLLDADDIIILEDSGLDSSVSTKTEHSDGIKNNKIKTEVTEDSDRSNDIKNKTSNKSVKVPAAPIKNIKEENVTPVRIKEEAPAISKKVKDEPSKDEATVNKAVVANTSVIPNIKVDPEHITRKVPPPKTVKIEKDNQQANGNQNIEKDSSKSEKNVKPENQDPEECIENIENFVALVTNVIDIS